MKKKILLFSFVICFPMILAAQLAQIPYPLGYCIISKQKLGSMGEPATIVYKNREVKFCCKGCTKEFYTAPDRFLQEIEAVAKQQ